jgi:hypothetical protein
MDIPMLNEMVSYVYVVFIQSCLETSLVELESIDRVVHC